MLAQAAAQTQEPAQNQAPVQTKGQTNDPDQPYYDGKPQPAPLSQPPVSKPGTVTVPAGTKIPLRLENSISTKSARPGDGVYMRTIFPVAVDNTLVIPVGTYVQAVITYVNLPAPVLCRPEV